MSISPAKLIPLHLRHVDDSLRLRVQKYLRLLSSLGKISHVHFIEADETIPVSASALVGSIELLIPMAGLIDKAAELHRLAKELNKVQQEIAFFQSKLNNEKFVSHAPAEIIDKERDKLAQAVLLQEKLLQHQSTIAALT